MANKKDNVRFEDFEALIKDLENSPEEQEKLLKENGIDKDQVYSEAEDFAKRMSTKKPGKVICIQQKRQPIEASKCKKKITITLDIRLLIKLTAAVAASVILALFVKSYLFHTDKPNIPQPFAKKTEPVLNRDTGQESKEAVQNTIPNLYNSPTMMPTVKQNKPMSGSSTIVGAKIITQIRDQQSHLPFLNIHDDIIFKYDEENRLVSKMNYSRDSGKVSLTYFDDNYDAQPNIPKDFRVKWFTTNLGTRYAITANSIHPASTNNWEDKFMLSSKSNEWNAAFLTGSEDWETKANEYETAGISHDQMYWYVFPGNDDRSTCSIGNDRKQSLQSTAIRQHGLTTMLTYDACNRVKSISHHAADGNSYVFSLDGKEIIGQNNRDNTGSIWQSVPISLYNIRKPDSEFENAFNNYQLPADSLNTDYITEVASLFNNLGNVYQKGFKLNDSEEAYKKALDIYERMRLMNAHKYEESLASTLSNLANLYSIKNNLTAAETCYKKASEIYMRLATSDPKTFEPELASLYSKMGLLYNKTNDLQKAEMLYRRALDIYQRLGIKIPENP